MLTSIDNPKIKALLKLKTSKERKKENKFILKGPHLVKEARNLNLSRKSRTIASNSASLLSHLFSTIITPSSNLAASPAIRSSSSLNGSEESKTKSAMSEFSKIFSVLFSANLSIPSILPRFLIPAVSTNSNLLPSNS